MVADGEGDSRDTDAGPGRLNANNAARAPCRHHQQPPSVLTVC